MGVGRDLLWVGSLGLSGCLINSSLYIQRSLEIQTVTSPRDGEPTAETGLPPTGDDDADGDGWPSGLDCDDGDPSVFPGACEVCEDGIDQDCNGIDAVCHPQLVPGYDLQASGLSFTGSNQDDNSGIVVGGVGDFNGDGLADVVIGASQTDYTGDASGSAYLLLSPITTGGPLITATRFDGEAADDRAGVSVSGADVDGDGLSDLIIGAKNHRNGRGAAHVVSGRRGALSLVEPLATSSARFVGEPGSAAGTWVSGLDGVLGIGRGGAAIGAPLHDGARGRVYLLPEAAISPGSSASLIDVAATLDGELPGDEAGTRLEEIGDVDGDGMADLLVGAMKANNLTGTAYLVLGDPSLSSGQRLLSTADHTFFGESLGDRAGSSVGGGGDVDGDGRADLLIGARRESSVALDQGAAYLVSSDTLGELPSPPLRRTLSDADAKIIGEASGDRLGQSVAIPGDVDCDGFADLLVGADRHGAGEMGVGDAQGAIYLIFGPVAGVRVLASDPTAVVFLGTPGANDQLGVHLDGAGDVDGDGVPDLIFGAYTAEVGGFPGVGRSWLVFGSPL